VLGAVVAAALWTPTALLFGAVKPEGAGTNLIVAGFPVSAATGALLARRAAMSQGMDYRLPAQFAVLAVVVGSVAFSLPHALFRSECSPFVGALFGYALLGLLVMGLPLLILGFNLALLWAAIVRTAAVRLFAHHGPSAATLP